jgi:mono/diheme cytochrome c family protein
MNRLLSYILSLLVLTAAACGGGSGDGTDAATSASDASPEAVTAADIGPVTSVDLGPLDAQLAAEGEEIYNTRCTACHKLDARYVGPPLADVMDRRDPVFVMNMILAPEKMIQQHPEAKELFAEYGTIMTNQNLTEEQARAILEYLRQVSEDAAN